MLILILLTLPVLTGLIMFLVKNKTLNLVLMTGYSLFYLVSSFFLLIYKPEFTQYFKVDSLNIIFIIVLGILNAGVSIYNVDYLKSKNVSDNEHAYYCIFYTVFIGCMTGVIMSTHIGLLWVFVEATTLTSAYLIYFNKDKASLEAAWKYIFICSIGISLAFVGIILLSIGTISNETLFFDSLYRNAKNIVPFWLKLSFVFILIGFGTKMGLAPVHAWLPDAHSESPSPVSAMLSGALLNTAFLGILRIYKVMELADLKDFANTLLLIMGFLSLLIAAAFLFRTDNYKRMLAYSSIENMGIIAIGIGIGGGAVYAAVLHLVSHSLTKGSLFLTAGNILHRYKTKRIGDVRGLIRSDRITGWLLLFSFIMIIGMPPSPIFISEFLMVKEMIAKGNIMLLILFLLLLTIIIYGIGNSVFMMLFGKDEAKGIEDHVKASFLTYVPQILFLTILVILGIYIPGIVNELINNAVNLL
jgi:hydrogenase-4 component F